MSSRLPPFFCDDDGPLFGLDALGLRDRLKEEAFEDVVVAGQSAGLKLANDHRHQDPDRRSTRAITF